MNLWFCVVIFKDGFTFQEFFDLLYSLALTLLFVFPLILVAIFAVPEISRLLEEQKKLDDRLKDLRQKDRLMKPIKDFPQKLPSIAALALVTQDPELSRVYKDLLEDINDWFCKTREIPMGSDDYKKILPSVVLHMAKYYTGVYTYNGWHCWHKCRDLGILKNGLPAHDCQFHNHEVTRITELYKLGGSEAVRAYRDVFK